MSTSLFEKKICDLFPLRTWEKYRVCLAISGGPDSVALLRAMASIAEQNELQKNLLVATVNHGLRGKESDDEAIFVKDLAFSLGLSAVIKSVDSEFLKSEVQRTKSLENAARNARYQLLLEAAEQGGARYVLTAHHRDDQLETILFRLMRGAGFESIRGMKVFRPLNDAVVLARPMLAVTRQEVLEYLSELHQDYKTDSSNVSPKHTRNRIRNELVPTLNSIFPEQWQRNLLRHVSACNEIHERLEREVCKLESDLLVESRRNVIWRQTLNALRATNTHDAQDSFLDPDSIAFPLSTLQQAPEEVLRVFFRRVWQRQKWPVVDMSAEEWSRLAKAVKTGAFTNQFPGNIVLTYSNNGLIAKITRKKPTSTLTTG